MSSQLLGKPKAVRSGCDWEYYDQLKEYVAEGATLFLSNADGFFSEIEEFFGFRIRFVESQSPVAGTFALNGKEIPYAYGQRRIIDPKGATVLAADSEGNPLLLQHTYGKGKVVFLNFPMEEQMLKESYAFEKGRHQLYATAFGDLLASKRVRAGHDKAIVIEGERTVTLLNFSAETIRPQLQLNGVEIDTVAYGDPEELPPCGACVFTIK